MHSVDSFNSRKIGILIQRIQYLFIMVTVTLTGLVCFFAFKWFSVSTQEAVYFVTPEGTYCSKKRRYAIRCEEFELENFSIQFMKHAFENNEYTYEDHLNAALSVMDRKSGLLLKSKFNEDNLFDLYKNYNGVSTLAIDSFQANMEDYPYEVVIFYTVKMDFLGLEAKKIVGEGGKKVSGGVYFKLKTTHRSKENPYGLCITHFSFVDYKHKDNDGKGSK